MDQPFLNVEELRHLLLPPLALLHWNKQLKGWKEKPPNVICIITIFRRFLLGETGKMSSPGRREIGHGALAERALIPVIPSEEKFPYTIRVVSEIMSSNGSTSMASVCGSTLSLMDAGVPITTMVAGIAMGLVTERGEYEILTDIIGIEDHCGDMDFKVAGSIKGITAMQMDIKINGITKEILKKALEHAKNARLSILGKMKSIINTPRTQISPLAPKIAIVRIDQSSIRRSYWPGWEND